MLSIKKTILSFTVLICSTQILADQKSFTKEQFLAKSAQFINKLDAKKLEELVKQNPDLAKNSIEQLKWLSSSQNGLGFMTVMKEENNVNIHREIIRIFSNLINIYALNSQLKTVYKIVENGGLVSIPTREYIYFASSILFLGYHMPKVYKFICKKLKGNNLNIINERLQKLQEQIGAIDLVIKNISN